MKEELKAKLEQIKNECRQTIDMAKKATEGPWDQRLTPDRKRMFVGPIELDYDDVDHNEQDANARLIAHSRAISHKQAGALLTTIGALEIMAFGRDLQSNIGLCDNYGMGCQACEGAVKTLERIAREWEGRS